MQLALHPLLTVPSSVFSLQKMHWLHGLCMNLNAAVFHCDAILIANRMVITITTAFGGVFAIF